MLMFFFSILSAKEYRLTAIRIKAAVAENGSLRIEESRTYEFSGLFSWADYRLPLEKLGTVRNFRLHEGPLRYTESPEQVEGTYTITRNETEFYVRWYYQARDETRTFTLNYEVADAVTVYDDVAEFYYKFIGEDNTRPVTQVDVLLELPQPADPNFVHAWAHGPLHGTVSFNTGELLYQISPLPAYQYWEARVIFPAGWISAPAARRIEENHLPQVVAEETAWASEANLQRERAAREVEEEEQRASEARPWDLVLSVAAFVGWIFLYSRYGKSFSVPYTQTMDPNYPGDLPPAVVSALYYDKQVYGAALSSTLIDLARRGFVSLHEQPQPAARWWQSKKPGLIFILDRNKFNQEKSALADFETDLLVFLFDGLGGGKNEIDSDVLKKQSVKVRSWFRKWSKLVRGHYKTISLYDAESKRATVISVIFSVFIIICGILLVVLLSPFALFALIAGCLILGASFLILRYTPEIKLKKKQWRAFRRYIKNYPDAAGNLDLKLSTINQYLVYGLALGLGEKEIRKLVSVVPERDYGQHFPWFIYSAHATPGIGNLATALSSVVNIAGSTLSSAAGAGGGASAGAGAGAGGAAGGAG
jgi:uncharacterized membrane protein